ncbi:hypothetical protein C8R43DRAFT_1141352 [Mycena crocata]|nr:hypothetical protein C8R43DRAFT_1141352 [Mycena crocata]
MSSSSESQELPAYLERQIRVSGYVFAGSTAVFVWDILNNLRRDYILLFKQKMSLASAAYIASRLASLIYTLGFTLFASKYPYPLPACNRAFIAFNSFYPIGVSATAFLFFFRVRAVWAGSRVVTVIFGFLWLSVLGTSILIPTSGAGIPFGNPTQCIIANTNSHVGSSGITVTIHDTMVFFAISYRLVSDFAHAQRPPGEKIKDLFIGTNLPAFSKSLFSDGQMYYMITVVSNIVTTVMVYVPSVSPVYHGLLVIPNLTLTSIMACRVYRNTKLGRVGGCDGLVLPTLNSQPSQSQTMQLSVVQFNPQRSEPARSGHASEPRDKRHKVTDSGFALKHNDGVVP